MQKEQPQVLQEDSHATDQFDDTEYERWSASLQAGKSTNPNGEVETFLSETKKP